MAPSLGKWGKDIVVGAKVSSQGRHGTGQPVVSGTVVAVDGDQATIRVSGVAVVPNRKRSISNLRRIS